MNPGGAGQFFRQGTPLHPAVDISLPDVISPQIAGDFGEPPPWRGLSASTERQTPAPGGLR
jgi:hypothetical protein